MTTLYLFTSNYGEYYKDVLDILAFPRGLKYRFRYDTTHLAPALRDGTDLSYLTGGDALLALKSINDKSGYDALPVRHAKITNVSLFEDTFIYFEFELLDFPKIDEDVVREFSEFVQKKFMSKAYVEQNDQFNFTKAQNQLESWETLVEHLEKIDKYNSSVFIRLYNISDQETGKTISISNYAYQMKGGRSYKLEFIHRVPTDLFNRRQESKDCKDVHSKVFFSSETFSPIIVEKDLRGRYDLNSHYFYCFRNMRTASALIVLGGVCDSGIYLPTFNLPVSVEKSWTRDNIFILLVGIGLAVAGVADVLVKGIGKAQQLDASISPSTIIDILIRGWLESGVIAPILAIIGLILAFINRFPKV
jgi:hypothetical protein